MKKLHDLHEKPENFLTLPKFAEEYFWKKTLLSHVVGVLVLQISYLLSCAGVWLGQHYYAIATVIIYKSH